MISYTWQDELNCSLCNPAEAIGLCAGGVRVTGPGGVDISICDECLGVLDSMAFVDHYERPHAPQALTRLGVSERAPQTKVRVRRSASRHPSQSFSHRAGLVVAVKHLCQQWRARADQIDLAGARCIKGGETRESVDGRLTVVSETLRYCADNAGKLVQPDTRTAVISDYPAKDDEPCAATNE